MLHLESVGISNDTSADVQLTQSTTNQPSLEK